MNAMQDSIDFEKQQALLKSEGVWLSIAEHNQGFRSTLYLNGVRRFMATAEGEYRRYNDQGCLSFTNRTLSARVISKLWQKRWFNKDLDS